MGRVTAPEPHNPPTTRRAARLQRERDAERALAAGAIADADAHAPREPEAAAPREPLPHTVPLPVIDLTPAREPAAAEPAPEPPAALRSRGRRRSTTGPTPIRVGAAAPPTASSRRAAKTADLMAPAAPPARHRRAPRSVRFGVVASLAVVASLVLASTASVTAALSGQGLFGVAEGRTAVVAAPAPPTPAARVSDPLPVQVQVLPAPTVQAAPAAVELCAIPAFAAALTAGDDAGAIAAAGGAEKFRLAVAGGTAPCVALDDPARVWVVLNKTRPNSPIDYRPAALAPPAGVRSLEGGSLRSDAAAALSAMAGAAAAAGVGEIALQSGFRSYETQQSTYGSQVSAQGAEQADLTSARPGFSEHQSGLAGDVVACADGCGTLDDLAATAQGQWIVAHAWEFGWVTRYEAGYTPITGYSPEPWHLRYIGPELARAYHDGGWHTLEEFFGLPAAPGYL